MDRRAEHPGEVVERNPPPDREPLFRPEAIAERQSQWLGTVLLAPKISHGLFVAFAALAVAGILSLLFFAEYTRKERINGWLVPEQGLVRVVAPRPGVITRLHVRDGDKVTAGAALITLSTEVQSEAFGATQEEIVSRLESRRDSLIAERGLHRKLLVEEMDGLAKRIVALRSERGNLAGELEIQRSQAKLALEPRSGCAH